MERTTAKMPLRVKKHRLSPVKTIVLGYVVIILTGALLLTLPISTRDWVWTSFDNALFTATSATCVTGLVVFDTYTYWSVFGQIVIILLIQIGGIGFMTLAISALTLTKRKIGLRDRYTLQESVNAPQVGGIVKMTRFILLGTAIFEITGAVLLAFRFCPEYGLLKGIYFSVFHSVSAFCNAGFDLMGGGGKSGILCCWQAKKQVGVNGHVICVDGFKKSINRAMSVGVADEYLVVNATDAVAMYEEIYEATEGQMADVVINVVNIPNTEMASILACKDNGMVYFFSMATSFTKAALGAEGVGKDVTMLIGNGYTKGHANVALQILREDERIRNLFAQLYA